MTMHLSEDIHSITELKQKTRELLNQARQTGRPIILTVNGRADAVLLDAKTYEKRLQVSNLSRLLAQAEQEVISKRTRPMRSFLKEFKNARKV